MPEELVREHADREADVGALAARFDVSPIAMAYRLVTLEILEVVPRDIADEQTRWRRSV